ncbi:transcriptional regulator, partial [Streptomyces sp. NPDC052101]|uniref:transcriptional regulator n=1 Tax=Streptomyces sp. NPDC052101 TaxID=3155763 RepID=UPI003443ACC2
MARSRSAAPEGRNDVLERHLNQLGWSVRSFAQRVFEYCQKVGISYTGNPGTVSRWCTGDNRPSPPLAAAACHVLSMALGHPVPPRSLGWPEESNIALDSLLYRDLPHAARMLAELWELDAGRDRRLVERTFRPGEFRDASHQALVMPPDTDLSGHGRFQVMVSDIELLEAQTRVYGRLDARHGGGKYRSVFAAFLSTHATPLLNGGFTERLGRRLYGSVADAVLATASMAYDDELPGLAQRYDLQALRLAQAIGDRARIARVHIHQARLAAAQGERRDVITHARAAVLASAGVPPLVMSYAAITEARAWALNRQQQPTLDAVARAREAFTAAGHARDPEWLSWFDRCELEGQAAWALAVAGLADDGMRALQTAKGMAKDRTRDRVELMIT